MRTFEQIEALLDELEFHIADDLEDQDLDFKEWDIKSMDKSVKMVIRMAVCMANGGGGSVVFGVAEHVKGRKGAILGVPNAVRVNDLKLAVYNQTDPKLSPIIEELFVPEGTGRLLVMNVYPGLPPYTDTAGKGSIRIGKDCQPLTGTLRRKIAVETGEDDFSAELVAKVDRKLIAPSAMESLRTFARGANAPDDLLALDDLELLSNLGLESNGKLSRSAILLAGSEDAIREFIPSYSWTFLQMKTDVDYEMREDGASSITQAIKRIEDLLAPFNKITTVVDGLYHYEYKIWSSLAIREALLNGFGHNDMRIAGPVMVKLFPSKIEISNNGGFIGGITEQNILHHKPAARNRLLTRALTALRLINHSNLGISRMFSEFLMEGKEPPIIEEIGESVTVTLRKSDLNAAFRFFVQDELEKGNSFDVDSLLLLQKLFSQPSIDLKQAAKLCQRSEDYIGDKLVAMDGSGYLSQMGTSSKPQWIFSEELRDRFAISNGSGKLSKENWNAAKAAVLEELVERAENGQEGLSNSDIRKMTSLDRNQVFRMMTELREANPEISVPEKGRSARYSINAHINAG